MLLFFVWFSLISSLIVREFTLIVLEIFCEYTVISTWKWPIKLGKMMTFRKALVIVIFLSSDVERKKKSNVSIDFLDLCASIEVKKWILGRGDIGADGGMFQNISLSERIAGSCAVFQKWREKMRPFYIRVILNFIEELLGFIIELQHKHMRARGNE